MRDAEMVTQEQVITIIQALNQAELTMRKIRRCLQLAILKYEVNGQVKTLPDVDKEALVEEYKKLKIELKTQLESLP